MADTIRVNIGAQGAFALFFICRFMFYAPQPAMPGDGDIYCSKAFCFFEKILKQILHFKPHLMYNVFYMYLLQSSCLFVFQKLKKSKTVSWLVRPFVIISFQFLQFSFLSVCSADSLVDIF